MKLAKLKRVLIYITLILLILLLMLILFTPVMCPYHSESYYEGLEEKYHDTLKYTPECDHLDIMMLAYRFRDRGEIKKCKELMIKADECIALYPKERNTTLLKNSENYQELCKERK